MMVVTHRGKVHDYLGMILDYLIEDKVMINISQYVSLIISDFPEEINFTKTTPGADHLLNIRPEDEATPLPKEQAILFHHTVAQLLFVSAPARRDIQPMVAFLTT